MSTKMQVQWRRARVLEPSSQAYTPIRNIYPTAGIRNFHNPKTKRQARAIANNCYKYIMDLTINDVITDSQICSRFKWTTLI
jgi:hypothetical protein